MCIRPLKEIIYEVQKRLKIDFDRKIKINETTQIKFCH